MSWAARRCGGRGGPMVRRIGVALAVALVFGGSGALAGEDAAPAGVSSAALRQKLQAALVDARRNNRDAGQKDSDTGQNNSAAALDALRAIIDAPAFATLSTSEQHAALAEAASRAERLKRDADAESLASRAIALPEQSIYDWRTRLFAAVVLGDAPVEAESLATIGRRWRSELGRLPVSTILTIDTEARDAQLGDIRREILEELFDIRLHTADGGEPRYLWRDLSLMLLEDGKRDQAIFVASHVTDAYDIVAMRADNRYRPLLKSGAVPHDPHKAAMAEIDRLKRVMQLYPRSLEAVHDLMEVLTLSGQNQKALDLADEVKRRVEAAAGGPAPYDDLDSQFGWILSCQSWALRYLGRFDEAVAPLQHALMWETEKKQGRRPSHEIDLAALLCELNRPHEALPLLPTDADGLWPYGKMRRANVNLMIQMELGDTAAVESALVELRGLAQHSPEIMQRALAVAGRDDEATALLLSRLRSSQLRADALVDLQDYGVLPRTAVDGAWHARLLALRDRPEIRAELAQVGKIERYPSIY